MHCKWNKWMYVFAVVINLVFSEQICKAFNATSTGAKLHIWY